MIDMEKLKAVVRAACARKLGDCHIEIHAIDAELEPSGVDEVGLTYDLNVNVVLVHGVKLEEVVTFVQLRRPEE